MVDRLRECRESEEREVVGTSEGPAWAWLRLPPTHHLEYHTGQMWRDRTLGDLARTLAESDPGGIVVPNDPKQPTYENLLIDAEALASSLQLEFGLAPGDVVSFQLPN